MEKLKKSNLEVPWLTKKANTTQYGPFLVHCVRGDITKVKEFIKKVPKEQK